jgi:SsrA-binding protein
VAKTKAKKDLAFVPERPGDKLICKNRQAERNFELGESFEAGLVLRGTEAKSCRAGKADLTDAFVQFKNGEAFLHNCRIAEYDHGGRHFNHEPTRPKKLLLHAEELARLARKTGERGSVAIPLSLYFRRGRVKVLFALGRGRSHEDRRQVVKDRDTARDLQRVLNQQATRGAVKR